MCRAWEQFLEEVQRGLPLRIYAAAVISMHELGANFGSDAVGVAGVPPKSRQPTPESYSCPRKLGCLSPLRLKAIRACSSLAVDITVQPLAETPGSSDNQAAFHQGL